MSIIRGANLTEAEVARFWSKVNIVWDGDSCWEWLGYCHRDGHGQFRLRGKIEYAHRVAWAIVQGCTPYYRLLCHTCNNPRCVRPDHQYVGDKSSNALDYWRAKQASEALREHYAKQDAA